MKKRLKSRGWEGESIRHALASKGIPTTISEGEESKGLTIDDIASNFGLVNLYHLTASGLATQDNLELSSEMKETITNLNEEADYKYEWIADLDHGGDQIYINDAVISDKTDESEMDWRENITQEEEERGEQTDEDNCVGYIHYHPESVDKRPTAQDFILALSIDSMRNEYNKDRFRPTTFAVVRDDSVRFYFLTPPDEKREEYIQKFKNIDTRDKNEYFKKVENQIKKMKEEDILHETKDIKIQENSESSQPK